MRARHIEVRLQAETEPRAIGIWVARLGVRRHAQHPQTVGASGGAESGGGHAGKQLATLALQVTRSTVSGIPIVARCTFVAVLSLGVVCAVAYARLPVTVAHFRGPVFVAGTLLTARFLCGTSEAASFTLLAQRALCPILTGIAQARPMSARAVEMTATIHAALHSTFYYTGLVGCPPEVT